MSMPTNQKQPSIVSPPLSQSSGKSRLRMLFGMALILVATCAAYFPAIHGQFLWDDDQHVTKPELRSMQGLHRIWFEAGATEQYYPLLHSAFWLEYQLWGDRPLGYHLVNLLLHCAAAGLVFLILRKLQIPGAWLATAIFALHPVQVESVAWITEQKNTLSAVFYLGAMLTYLQFDQTRNRSTYALALGLFLLALLSKTTTVTLPAALLVILWWQRGSLSWQREVQPLAPFFLLSATAGLFTAWIELKVVGATGGPFELSLLERTLLASRAVWFYLGKLVWPNDLIFMYPRWSVSTAVGWQWMFLLATLAAFVTLWLLRRRRRGPLAAWLFFVGTLFPLLGFFNAYLFIYTYVADHFQYLASLGIFVLASSVFALAIARLSQPAQWIGNGLCLLLLITLATLTWQQAEMYSDIVTLYRTTLDRNPTCWVVHYNLGIVLAKTGRPQEAIEHYQQALQIRPDYVEAHNNLGKELYQSGRTQEAIAEYQESLRLNPNYYQALNNLGVAFSESGRPQDAIPCFEKALRLAPDYADAHNNLGNALVAVGQPEEAIKHYQRAMQLNPDLPETHFNLGTALHRVGRLQEAIEQYQLALQLKPNDADAHNNLGLAFASAGRTQEAIEQFQATLLLEPNNAQTCVDLMKAYAQLQRPTEAIATAEKALQLARSLGQTALAEQIEAWLKNYRSQQATSPDESGQPSTLKPSP